MRAVPSESGNPQAEDREKSRTDARSARRRKARLRTLAMETLEARELLASSLQSIVPGTNTVLNVPGNAGNQLNPSVAYDPTNPQDMVAVWVDDDPGHTITGPGTNAITTFIEGAFSTNGGASWSAMPGSLGNHIQDPSTTTATALTAITDASVAFDGNHNVYIVDEAHQSTTGYGAGQITTERFSFPSGGAPSQTLVDNPVYKWTAQTGAVYKPIIAADGNQTTFTDSSGATQSDPATTFTPLSGGTFGAVFITLQTDQNGSNPTLNSTVEHLRPNGLARELRHGAAQQRPSRTGHGASRISISQGTATVGGATPTVPGGQATVV